jgi:hypothetical protein
VRPTALKGERRVQPEKQHERAHADHRYKAELAAQKAPRRPFSCPWRDQAAVTESAVVSAIEFPFSNAR